MIRSKRENSYCKTKTLEIFEKQTESLNSIDLPTKNLEISKLNESKIPLDLERGAKRLQAEVRQREWRSWREISRV